MKENKKSDRFETSERIRKVVDWILADKSHSEITKLCEKEFGIKWRQAERYIQKAWSSFEEKNQVAIERKKGYYIQRKRKLISEMPDKVKKTASGANAINRILDSMAMIDGTMTTKVEVSGKDGKPIEQNYNITLNIK